MRMRKLQLSLPGSHWLSTASPTHAPVALSVTARSRRSGWPLRVRYQSRRSFSSSGACGARACASSWTLPVRIRASGSSRTARMAGRSSSRNGRSAAFSPVSVGLIAKSGRCVISPCYGRTRRRGPAGTPGARRSHLSGRKRTTVFLSSQAAARMASTSGGLPAVTRPARVTGRTYGGPARRPPAEPVIAGRDAELALLAQFLDAGEARAAVLTGAAGIGKTALWEWATARAAGAGHLVLASRAGAAEAQLPWVGLTDLLRSAEAPVIAGLPAPQREALRVVMLQSGHGEPADERAVGTALLSVLIEQALRRPVLIALDDLPYLDAATTGALRFALRRLGQESHVRLIATARGEGSRWAPLDGLPGDRVLSIAVGPVTVAALFELLAGRLAVRLARPVLLRVHATSGGNPLYALELARALDRLEIAVAPGMPLPVPTSLDALVAERVRSLPRDVLLIAAGTAASWRFTDEGLEPGALERAELAGIVIVDELAVPGGVPVLGEGPVLGGPRTVRAAHPLMSAAAYAALPAAERRAPHPGLPTRPEHPAQAGRHAALAATRADPRIAVALDAGVAAALAAGAPDIAVELSRLALAHTSADADRAARLDLLG